MPVNKAARVRHEILDECLRTTNRKWTKQDLLERVNRRLSEHYGQEKPISLSQLRYDLESMQAEYGAPIESRRAGKMIYYYYEDPDFSILNIPVTEEELQKLGNAIELLKQINGFTISDEILELTQKLERKVKFTKERTEPIIEFEKTAIAYGLEHLEDLYYAILSKRVLKVFYQSFRHADIQEWIIHPYFLKQYNSRWYLLGLYEPIGTLGLYALDRIKKITVCNHPYIENTNFDSKVFFNDIIGVTLPPNKQKEEIIINVSSSRAPYLKTKPLHPSQRIISHNEDGTITIGINVIVNPELISHLLFFGPDINVQAPGHLKNEIKGQLQESLSNYKK